MMEIVPSLIASQQSEVDERTAHVLDVADIFQLDVMDGLFVPAHSFDFAFDLPVSLQGKKIEAHLMVADPASWIKAHGDCADIILPHIESCDDPHAIIKLIRSQGKKAGFALKPDTPLDVLSPYLDDIDEVIILAVQPGQYGAPFIPESIERVRTLRTMSSHLIIEVDGHVTPETIGDLREAGCDRFVVGSFLQNADDVQAALAALLAATENKKKRS